MASLSLCFCRAVDLHVELAHCWTRFGQYTLFRARGASPKTTPLGNSSLQDYPECPTIPTIPDPTIPECPTIFTTILTQRSYLQALYYERRGVVADRIFSHFE